MEKDLWKNIKKDYSDRIFAKKYSKKDEVAKIGGIVESATLGEGVNASDLLWLHQNHPEVFYKIWIPGMYIVPITVNTMPARGTFAEFYRDEEGIFNLMPQGKQTSVSFMYKNKGFHIHPPLEETEVEDYDNSKISNIAGSKKKVTCKGQWDLQVCGMGSLRFTGVDLREGFDKKRITIIVDGLDRSTNNTCAVTFPPGIAHAIELQSPAPVQLLYVTSNIFTPEYEGRINSSNVEGNSFPDDWKDLI